MPPEELLTFIKTIFDNKIKKHYIYYNFESKRPNLQNKSKQNT